MRSMNETYSVILCCLYLVQDSFTDYLLCVSSNECVAGHYERITHDNRPRFRVILTIVWPDLKSDYFTRVSSPLIALPKGETQELVCTQNQPRRQQAFYFYNGL